MIEEIDFETYLYVSRDMFQVFVYDKINQKTLYNEELKIYEKFDFQNFNNLSKFLDNNIFKIEKLIGTFVKDIILIIESEKNFHVHIGIKKKEYNNLINKKYLENTLIELKDLFKENYYTQHIMHLIINNYYINGKKYSLLTNFLDIDNLCLEVKFTSISNDLIIIFEKILEKYQIKINQYMDGNYISNLCDVENYEISEMANKVRNGYNQNEVILIPKDIKNKGFFEKFFQLFS
jgi:hypothetical protein